MPLTAVANEGHNIALADTALVVAPAPGDASNYLYVSSSVDFYVDINDTLSDLDTWPAGRGYLVAAGATWIHDLRRGRLVVAATSGGSGTVHAWGVVE